MLSQRCANAPAPEDGHDGFGVSLTFYPACFTFRKAGIGVVQKQTPARWGEAAEVAPPALQLQGRDEGAGKEGSAARLRLWPLGWGPVRTPQPVGGEVAGCALGARCRRRSASGQGCAKARAGGKKSLKPGFRNTHGSRLADVLQLSLSTSPAFYTSEARKREGKDRQKRQERSRFPYRISELFVYSYRAWIIAKTK